MPVAPIVPTESVKDLIQAWAQQVVNDMVSGMSPAVVVTCIFDWQAETIPLKPWVGLRMTQGEMTAFTDQVNVDNAGTFWLEGSRRFHVQCECFSDAINDFAEYMALALQTSFQQTQYYQPFFALGGQFLSPPQTWSCSVTKVYPLTDLTAQINEVKYERRVVLEFDLLVDIKAPLSAPSGTPGIGEIDEVQSSGTVSGIGVTIDVVEP